MDLQRRLFLKRFSQLLLYRGLPLSKLMALAACAGEEDQDIVTAQPDLDDYTPLLATATPDVAARFAVIGDYGTGDRPAGDVAALVKSWDVDFIVTTGDNNYYNGKASTIDENVGQFYHEFIHPYKGSYGPGAEVNRFFPALGGHDWRQPNAAPYLEYFTLPGNERYYEVRHGAAHIFVLDSIEKEPDGVDSRSTQARWLRGALMASDARWKLVVTHDPPYSSGETHGTQRHMQWPFREWGANAVIAGNDHVYERILVGDFPYIVNGCGGGRLYDFEEDETLPGSVARFNRDHGAMLVEASSERADFRFVTRSGETIDEFSLV